MSIFLGSKPVTDYIDMSFYKKYLVVAKYHGNKTCHKYIGDTVVLETATEHYASCLVEVGHYPVKDSDLMKYITLQDYVDDDVLRTLLYHNINIVGLSTKTPMEVYE